MKQTHKISIDHWGPAIWQTMHSISLAYPDNPTDDVKSKYNNFFHTIMNVLPCNSCRAHFEQLLQTYPPDLKSRDAIVRWLFRIHNIVNERTGKPDYQFTKFVYEYLHPRMYNLLTLSVHEKSELKTLSDSLEVNTTVKCRRSSLVKIIIAVLLLFMCSTGMYLLFTK